MSSPERRKQRKAQKERLQAKKQARLGPRFPQVPTPGQMKTRAPATGLVNAQETLTELVTSGRARIALTALDDLRQLMAVMWQPKGVQIHICGVDDHPGMLAMAAAAKEQQVSDDEWFTFINGHMHAAVVAGGRHTEISLIEWKPGERPTTIAPSTAPA
jgi:hypothetical protein